MNTASIGSTIGWLHLNRAGRAIQGTVESVSRTDGIDNGYAVVVIGTERKADAHLVGKKMYVPAENAQLLSQSTGARS